MDKKDNNIDRKEFLQRIGGLGLAAGLAATPASAPFAFTEGSPNEKVVVGVIGCHSRGLAHARAYAKLPHSEVGYICDVDSRWRAKGIKTVKEAGQKKSPKSVNDFRRILEDSSVDAVSIATPDHWHAPAAILALKAGKHVYVEKPSAHNPHEGKLLVEAAKKYGKQVQMGNQRRSWPNVIEGMNKIKEGAIGETYFARAWYGRARGPIGHGKEVPPPSTLDYELWQGPAPRTPYRDNITPYNWHWFWEWGTGEIGNNGTHFIDLARWGLDVDLPLRVSSNGGKYVYDGDWETPDLQTTSYDFEGDKTISWESRSRNAHDINGQSAAAEIFGTKGSLLIHSLNGYTLFDNDGNKIETVTSKESRLTTQGAGFGLDAGHFNNFLNAIRKGSPLKSPISDAQKSVLLIQLGNIAYRTKRELHCDTETGKIKENKEAMKYWQREYAPGWWVPTL